MRKPRKAFVLTQQHLDLLKHACVEWRDEMAGAPAINSKRPYGNKDWVCDIAEILGEPLTEDEREDDKLFQEREDRYRPLHEETETALQICLHTQQFNPGVYLRSDEYDSRCWEWVCEIEQAEAWMERYHELVEAHEQAERDRRIQYHQQQIDQLRR